MRLIILTVTTICLSIAASTAAGLWLAGFDFNKILPSSATETARDATPDKKQETQIASRSPEQSKPATNKVQDATAPSPPKLPKTEPQAAAKPAAPASQPQPSPFDVISIQPNGVSVFAGVAQPNRTVIVRANGKPIGSTTSDSGGNWVLATETKIANPDAVFTIDVTNSPPPQPTAKTAEPGPALPKPATSKPAEPVRTARLTNPSPVKPQASPPPAKPAAAQQQKTVKPATTTSADPSKTTQPATAQPKPKSVAQVTADMMARLESMVEQAKTEEINPLDKAPKPDVAPVTVKPAPKAPATKSVAQRKAPVPQSAQPVAKSESSPPPPLPKTAVAKVKETTAPKPAAKSAAAILEAIKGPTKPDLTPEQKLAAVKSPPKVKPVQRTTLLRTPPPPTPAETTYQTATATTPPPTPTSLSVPIPIQFIYREAEFTESGRKAADLLVQYLKAKRVKRARLTGHADERGTERSNYRLSQERLEAVDRFARTRGFTGELVLVPKGETEPYSGVNRNDYNREELHQLDRRVELHLN